MSLRILWPVNTKSSTSPPVKVPAKGKSKGLFVAFGRADKPMINMTWKYQHMHKENVVGDVKWSMALPRCPGNDFRWMAAIRVPELGPYRLSVTSRPRFSDPEEVARADFTVVTQTPDEDVNIGWPYSGDNVGDFRDDFAPYGSISGATLVRVVLIHDSTGAEIEPLSVYADPIELEFWTAQFDSVANAGDYTLRVVDSGNSKQDIAVHF